MQTLLYLFLIWLLAFAIFIVFIIHKNRKESEAYQILKKIKKNHPLISMGKSPYGNEQPWIYKFTIGENRYVIKSVSPDLASWVYSKVNWVRYELWNNREKSSTLSEDNTNKEKLFKYVEALYKNQ